MFRRAERPGIKMDSFTPDHLTLLEGGTVRRGAAGIGR